MTLSDVAGRAGVSSTSASYVLNGRSHQMRISRETERRVRQAARDLGYRPNRSARSLRTGTTKTIGLISDFIASGHFASQMLSGASAAAAESGHLLLIGETEGAGPVEHGLIEEMLDRQVDGIVYATLVTAERRLPPVLASHRVVLLNCTDPSSPHPSVLPDEHEGGRTAVRLLLEEGIRDGVFLVGEDPTPGALAGPWRTDGVQEELAARGLPPAGQLPCDWDVVPAHDAVDDWLEAGARPNALLCLNDRIAMGAYEALAARGLRVPEDVAVVSFDGSELASWLRPALTSVVVPYAAMGSLAVQLLMDRELWSPHAGRRHGDEAPGRVTGVPRVPRVHGVHGVHRVPMPVMWGASVRRARDSEQPRRVAAVDLGGGSA